MVFQSYVSPEHYFLQIDPEAQGGLLLFRLPAAAGPHDCAALTSTHLRARCSVRLCKPAAGKSAHGCSGMTLRLVPSRLLSPDLERPVGVLVAEVIEATKVGAAH